MFTPSGDGFLKAIRTGTIVSPLRTMSFESGQTASVSVDLKLSASGQIDLYSDKAVDYAVDIVGYWTSPTLADGARFEALDPTRVLNTASGTGTCSPSPCAKIVGTSTVTVDIAGQAGVPAHGVTAVIMNVTTLNTGGSGEEPSPCGLPTRADPTCAPLPQNPGSSSRTPPP